MKAAFFNPYLDSLGGGERYTLTLIEALNKQGWETVLFWDGKNVTDRTKSKFGIDISQTKYVSTSNWKLINRFNYLKDFDLVFFVSDGSLPFLFGKKNIVHFQVPFHDLKRNKLIDQVKKLTISEYVANSNFTKKIVDKEYGINSRVIYPPVDVKAFSAEKKEKVILYSARFSNLLQQKGHSIIISTFKKLYDCGIKDYELWLAGSTEIGSDLLLKQLKIEAKGYPIKFFTDIDFTTLKSIYGQARFFWSSVGFGIDEKLEPEKFEHFGMTLVESMAAGCIPVVYNGGGHKEVINDGINGYLWNKTDELVEITKKLTKDEKLMQKMCKAAVKKSENFSKQVFINSFSKT